MGFHWSFTLVSIQTFTTCLSSFSPFPEEVTLKKFWEIEDLPQSHHFTKEEQACEQHFQQTTTRNEDGLFIVKLPFKEDAILLDDSFQQTSVASKHFSTEYQKNESLYTRHVAFIEEHLDLGHMEKIPESEIPIESQALCRFYASAKTTSGFSLNDKLMLCPKTQKDLFEILIRFRYHKVTLSTDVAKLYRQVLLDKKDTDYFGKKHRCQL